MVSGCILSFSDADTFCGNLRIQRSDGCRSNRRVVNFRLMQEQAHAGISLKTSTQLNRVCILSVWFGG